MREAIKVSGEAGRLRVAAADQRLNQWSAAAGAAAARSEGEKVVQDVPSASEDPFKFEPSQETVDYEDDDDMQEAQPQQAVEEHDASDHVPTSPAS